MLKIRLQRRGRKNHATYRVVIADQRAPVKGRFIADVGYYNPHTNEFSVDKEQIQKWLSDGAQASSTVHNLLITNKVIKGEKVTSWTPKKKKVEDEGDTEEKAEKTKEVKTEEDSVETKDAE